MQKRMVWVIGLAVLVLALSGVGNSPVLSDDPMQLIESDDPLVQASGSWSTQAAGGASGGSYRYSSGSPDDILTLTFDGSSLTVIYVAGPQFGILAIEVDGTVLRTVLTSADNALYNQQAVFNYLEGGTHTLRLYASGGMVAVDAMVASPTVSSQVALPDGQAGVEAVPSKRGYDTLAALGEDDASVGPSMTLYNSFADTVASGDYQRQAVNYLVNVMGDWDGDGHDTYGTVYEGRFDYTNVTPDLFTNAEHEASGGFDLGVDGYPVVGRFSPAFTNDCIGVVSTFAGHPSMYLLNYVCDFNTPVVRQQYLGTPLPDQDGYTGPYSFAAGDFDGDGLDSVAVWRGPIITYTDVDPAAGDANFDKMQRWGQPIEAASATLLVGDWDGDGVDSFGVVYGTTDAGEVSYFYRRNDLGMDTGAMTLQMVTRTSRVAAWR